MQGAKLQTTTILPLSNLNAVLALQFIILCSIMSEPIVMPQTTTTSHLFLIRLTITLMFWSKVDTNITSSTGCRAVSSLIHTIYSAVQAAQIGGVHVFHNVPHSLAHAYHCVCNWRCCPNFPGFGCS